MDQKMKEMYNKLLIRHGKACVYMDDNDIPLETREKLLPKLIEIQNKLSYMLDCIRLYTNEEALGGFK